MTGEGDRTRTLRVRAFLDEWAWAIALVAAIALLAGGYATYTAYRSPGTVVEERQVSSWEGNGTYATTARVTEPNPLFPVGTELSDRPAYFTSVSPRLACTFAFEYGASDGGRLDVTLEGTLVLRAVEETDGESVEYWRIEEPLGTASESGVSPGQSVETTFSRNVSRLADRTGNVSERLGGSPGTTELLVSTEVRVAGEVNGRSVERTATYRLPIEVDNAVYAPGAVEGEAMSGTTTERVTVQRSYGPLWRIGGPLAAVLGLLALGGLGAGRARGAFDLDPAERDLLAHRATRAEFDDWITTARVPSDATAGSQVEVESLTGLVDTAIDTDERVIELPDRSAYYVLHGDHVYVHRPPAVVRSGPPRTAPASEGGSSAGAEGTAGETASAFDLASDPSPEADGDEGDEATDEDEPVDGNGAPDGDTSG